MSAILSTVGILAGIVFLMFFAYKGHDPVFIGIIVCVIVLVTSGMNVSTGLVTTFATGTGNMLRNVCILYIGAMTFGYVMEKVGFAHSIAYWIADRVPVEYSPLVIIAISIVMGVGGMAMSSYLVVLPIAAILFSKANYSRDIALACIIGGSQSFANCFPGVPSIHNGVVMNLLGVSSTAGLIPGIIAGVVILLINGVYVMWQARTWRKNGRVFTDWDKVPEESEDFRKSLPPVWLSISPVVLVLVIYNGLHLNTGISLLIGIIYTVIVRIKAFSPKDWLSVLEKGVKGSFTPMIHLCAMSGLGAIIALTPAYSMLVEFLGTLNMNPYLLFFLGANVMAFVCGSASAGIGVLVPATQGMLNSFVAQGYSLNNIGRMLVVGCMGMDSLPNNGALIAAVAISETTMQKSYKPIFFCTVLAPFVGGLIALPFCSLF